MRTHTVKTSKFKFFLMVLMITLYAVQGIYADQIYIVDSYKVNEKKITKGKEFTLTIDLKAIQSVAGQELTLVNTSSNIFSFKSSGSNKSIGSAKKEMEVDLELIYQGGGKTFSFNIIDNATSEVVATDSIVIDQVRVKDNDSGDTSPDNFDSTKVIPTIELGNQPFVDELSASKSNLISVKLRNTSTHTAKNVFVTLSAKDGNLPFDMRASKVPTEGQDIKRRNSEDFRFNLVVDKSAIAKNYEAVLKITYENAYGDSFTKEIPVYIAIDNHNSLPLVTVVESTLVGDVLSSDEARQLSIKISNLGTLNANNINVKLTGFAPNTVMLKGGSDSAIISQMAHDQSQVFTFDVIASPEAAGTQMLTVNFSYEDQNGKTYEKTAPIYLASGNAKGASVLDVMLSGHQFNMSSGQIIDISGTVKNPSQKALKNVVVTLESSGSVSFLSADEHIIKSLGAGESRTFNYRLTVGDEGAGSISSLKLVAKTSTGDGALSSSDRAGVIIAKLPDKKKDADSIVSIPKPIIEHYDYGGDYAYAGQQFPLTINVKNTHRTMALKNLKMTFTTEENTIIPVNASNAIFIASIGAGETAQARINLVSKNDAAQKIYSLNFKMTYEDEKGNAYDEKGNAYQTEEAITVNLKQENKLEIAEFHLPELNSIGKEIPLEIGFFNTGKSTLYNLLVKTEGNFEMTDGTYYVGNFEPGKSDYYNATILPNVVGDNTGKLIFTFEDADGTPSEITRDIAFVVDETPVDGGFENGEFPMEDGMPIEGDENGNPGDSENTNGVISAIKSYWWVLVPVVAIVGLGVFVRRRRKKRDQDLLDALLDDEISDDVDKDA